MDEPKPSHELPTPTPGASLHPIEGEGGKNLHPESRQVAEMVRQMSQVIPGMGDFLNPERKRAQDELAVWVQFACSPNAAAWCPVEEDLDATIEAASEYADAMLEAYRKRAKR